MTITPPGGQWLRLKQWVRVLPRCRGHECEGMHSSDGPDEPLRQPARQVVRRVPQHPLLVQRRLLRDQLLPDHPETLPGHLLLPLASRRGRGEKKYWGKISNQHWTGALQEDQALLRDLRVHLERLLPERFLSRGWNCNLLCHLRDFVLRNWHFYHFPGYWTPRPTTPWSPGTGSWYCARLRRRILLHRDRAGSYWHPYLGYYWKFRFYLASVFRLLVKTKFCAQDHSNESFNESGSERSGEDHGENINIDVISQVRLFLVIFIEYLYSLSMWLVFC